MILKDISIERLADRKALLKSFDNFRRDVDASGAMTGMDTFTEQAFGVLTSSRLAEAFDLSKEDPKMVERYGKGTEKLDKGGRDHWPKVSTALLAGGGMTHGQVIGSTTRDGGEADDRPVEFQEVFSTLYHNLGIDARRTTVEDLTGRPRFLVDSQHAPMKELVG